MDYIYGELNDLVKNINYSGIDTPTANTTVDNINRTIKVDVNFEGVDYGTRWTETAMMNADISSRTYSVDVIKVPHDLNLTLNNKTADETPFNGSETLNVDLRPIVWGNLDEVDFKYANTRQLFRESDDGNIFYVVREGIPPVEVIVHNFINNNSEISSANVLDSLEPERNVNALFRGASATKLYSNKGYTITQSDGSEYDIDAFRLGSSGATGSLTLYFNNPINGIKVNASVYATNTGNYDRGYLYINGVNAEVGNKFEEKTITFPEPTDTVVFENRREISSNAGRIWIDSFSTLEGEDRYTTKEIASIDQIPTNYVTLNTNQNITGDKTFTYYKTPEYQSLGIIENRITMDLEGLKVDGLNPNITVAKGTTELKITADDGEEIVLGRTHNNNSYSYYLPNNSGTLALTSDIPTNYVTTDTTQNITSIKHFKAGNSQLDNIDIENDYTNFWKTTTFLGNTKIDINDSGTPNFLATADNTTFSKRAVFNGPLDANGLLYAGGQELRFGGDYLNITDNTNEHNVIAKVHKDFIDFNKTATFKSALNVDGLIWTGGKEIRFPEYVEFKDNTNEHNVIIKVAPDYVNFEKVVTAKQGINIDVAPTQAQHAVRKDYVDNNFATQSTVAGKATETDLGNAVFTPATGVTVNMQHTYQIGSIIYVHLNINVGGLEISSTGLYDIGTLSKHAAHEHMFPFASKNSASGTATDCAILATNGSMKARFTSTTGGNGYNHDLCFFFCEGE